MADFETTVYEGQEFTEVWASSCCELFTEDVKLFHSLDAQFNYWEELGSNLTVYFHNLAFDGNFILYYLLLQKGYAHAGTPELNEKKELVGYRWKSVREMPRHSVKYHISDMGQWYSITVKTGDAIIEFRDSYKLLPFSVKQIGKDFKTKHQKGEIEYEGKRYAGCPITDEEAEYIKNDVLVVKEALEVLYLEGHNRLTIGSCCLAEFRNIVGGKAYSEYFPNLYEIMIDKEKYGAETADGYIRKAYKGAWCYLAKGKENRVYKNGVTLDVNSLYPSMMHSNSLNAYPVGYPKFWQGNYIPDEVVNGHKYYFIRVKTRFYLKIGKLPFIQIKNDLRYRVNEMLESSDINGLSYTESGGVKSDTRLTMTWSMTDYKLITEHYDLQEFEILDGVYFDSAIGIFDDYIDKYRNIKETSEGARRTLAKLFSNNLYGKLATNPKSGFKVAYYKEETNSLGFYNVEDDAATPVHIAAGAAVTSYARAFTIRAAQLNYYGPDRPGFIYADTDSLHLDLPLEEVKGVKLHDTAYGCWKCELYWSEGFYVRQKTYIEKGDEKLGGKNAGKYQVTCAGMPKRCKDIFITLLEKGKGEDEDMYSLLYAKKEEWSISDFTSGLSLPGKLVPKRISGGIILVETTFEIR